MKKVRIILIISIVVLTISIIGLIIYSVHLNKLAEDEYVMEKPVEEALEGKLYPNNFTEFYFKYKGEISTDDIYTKLYEIVEVGIPQLNSDIKSLDTDKKIKDYYENQSYVEKSIGINNVDDFTKLVNILRKFNQDSLQYTISEVVKSSSMVYSDRTEFELGVHYGDSNTMNLRVIVYNKKRSSNFIKIIPLIEE